MAITLSERAAHELKTLSDWPRALAEPPASASPRNRRHRDRSGGLGGGG
jgi:hypothetical protein